MAYPLAGHTNSYHTYSFDEALAGIAGAGFKGVELSAVPGWTEHVDLDADPGSVREQLGGYGLEAVSLSGHSDLTTRDGLEHGLKAVDWAGRYGLKVVNTAVGGHQSADENESAFLQNIGELADAADAAGVVVALEIHGDIMASSDVTLPLLAKIGRDSVKVNYDTANVEFYSGDLATDDLVDHFGCGHRVIEAILARLQMPGIAAEPHGPAIGQLIADDACRDQPLAD